VRETAHLERAGILQKIAAAKALLCQSTIEAGSTPLDPPSNETRPRRPT